MISKGGKLSKISVDIANKGYKIDNSNPVEALEFIHR